MRRRRRTLKKGRSWIPLLEGQAGPTGISRLGLSPIRCFILVHVLELATGLGVLSQRMVEESESVVSLQVVLVRELAILIPSNLQIIFSKIVHFIVC